MLRNVPARATTLAFLGSIFLAACPGSDPDAQPGTPGGPITVPVGTACTVDGECGGGRCVSGACVPGAACTDDSACAGSKCVNGGCVPLSATDGVKNGDETDVDCGGSVAPRCGDGKACGGATDCASKVCVGGVCAAPSPTDGVENGDESDVDCGGNVAPKCGTGKMCKGAGDCASAVCGPDKKCVEGTITDGVKNGDETDVDCGGAAAPKCAAGKACLAPTDCDSGFCTGNVCEPRMPGRKDGDETDVDCGGKVAPACDWDKACLVDADCTSQACGTNKKCLTGPSCRPVHGGSTCGTGEFGDGFKQHESCCRSLPVPGYTDPNQPGKTVYVDKYEITAGRMRAFIDAIAAANGGVPNIRGYIAAKRPARWNQAWEGALPTANTGSMTSFTITNPTPVANYMYPGQDQYLANQPTQNTWSVINGNYTVDVGVYYALNAAHFFPEYYSTVPPWQSTDYAATHNLNCTNIPGSYGYSTYWMPKAIISQYNGGTEGKFFSQNDMDEKALNCAPFGLFAAFCAWDGGQLVTEEVFDYITANGSRIAAGRSQCGTDPDPDKKDLNTFSDGTSGCFNVYFYPPDFGNNYDGSSRIAPPGRVPADVVRVNAGDEPWMDMIGNLEEAVIKKDETNRFQYKGWGVAWSSLTHHRNQISTARMKGGSFGARCMRFK
ncbi:MAG: hypothetical protein KC657_14745 [Myxococcales bacterium]|nr:hypothetical protein [Myxococcales bacterium]